MQKDGILVQESRRGKVCVCRVWTPVVLGRDEEQAEFVLREKGLLPAHCQLYAEFDGRVKVKPLGEAAVSVNGIRVVAEADAKLGDKIQLTPKLELEVLGVVDANAPKREKGMLRLPQRIPPHYLLLRLIGRGAAGLVYEAYDEERRRRCAIKLLIAGGRAIPELIARFKREAELQARLADYPGIVTVYDYGTLPDSGELFCAMEYVTGTTLRERLREGIPRIEGVRLLARIARACAYAHENGLIHRDLKPSNVLVSETGTVRLTDFGLCKALEDEEGLTATGVMLGTPSYMAPEQIEDAKRVGREADVYALGAMLFVVLTGRLPFGGDSIEQVLENVCSGELASPIFLDDSIDPVLNDACIKSMARDPDQRPKSCMDVARQLESWIKRVNPPKKVTLRVPKPKPKTKRRRRPEDEA